MTHEERRKRPEHHIVHDYANLVSSGKLITDPDWNDKLLKIAPVNSHVWHAFYMNCRKMYEFFTYRPHDRYLRAQQFIRQPKLDYAFKHWTHATQDFMDAQMLHVGMSRIDNERESTGADDQRYLADFEGAWEAFLRDLKPDHKDIFLDEIQYRLDFPGEFRHCGTLGKEFIVSNG